MSGRKQQAKPMSTREMRRQLDRTKEQVAGFKEAAAAMNKMLDGLQELSNAVPGSVDDEARAKFKQEVDLVNEQVALLDKVMEPMDVVLDYLDPDGAEETS